MQREYPMTLQRFHNTLRILLNIDMSDLVKARVFDADDDFGWAAFLVDPFRWLIRAPDAQAEALWTIIERRMK